MLQFMAAGLAIISTPAGVRGIPEAEKFCVVVDRDRFADTIPPILGDRQFRLAMGRSARGTMETNYQWSVVTDCAAQLSDQDMKYRKRMDPPFFSVVIPTCDRPDNLVRLLGSLAKQTFPDFEIVVVDQSNPPLEIPGPPSATASNPLPVFN